MATAAAPYDSYEMVDSLAEDVQDEVYIISPVDNPVASMSRSIRATGTIHEWLEDELRNSKKNAQVEGADAAPINAGSVPDRKQAYCQIMTESASVTGTLEEVDKYGRDSEMAYQLELKYGALGNDEETAIMGAFDGVHQAGTAGAAATARELTSLYAQIPAGDQKVDGSGYTTYAALEAGILGVHEAGYMNGANPSYLVTSPEGSRAISELALSAGRQRDIRNERRVVNVVDLYVSNFGELDVVLDRHIRNVITASDTYAQRGDFYLLDFNHLATPVLRATRDWALAKTGDADKRQILRESTFANLNAKAQGVIHGVDVSALTHA